ncbi:MAG TPA: ATP-binding protein [Candidatus Limnocylindrales bacterium]|nr:ATP-binding protein [Candidatus Limnocylindrales bacterium]
MTSTPPTTGHAGTLPVAAEYAEYAAPAPVPAEPSGPSREALAPLLLRRFRHVIWVTIVATSAYGVIHLAFDESHLFILFASKAVQILSAIVGYLVARRTPERRIIVPCMVGIACTMHIVTGITGAVVQDLGTTNLVFMMVALASSSYLPWGWVSQLVTVIVAAIAAAFMIVFGGSTGVHGATYQYFTLLLAFGASVLSAREVEKDTLAELREQAAVRALADSRAALERVLRQFNRELEFKVRSRTAELETANGELEAFAYSVSHDLRTPLRSIEGFATLLANDHGEELTPPALSHLARIQKASRNMSRLIDDLLTLSRVVRSELHLQRVDVTALFREVAEEIAARWPGRDVDFQVDDGLVADADPRLLRIVIVNLIDNAWKYTSRCQSARIHVSADRLDNETVFFVRDDGCGFDMRFVHKLFQPFQRLHPPTEYEGTGIGLATVARIVSRHGGRVAAEGKVGSGATFRFTLAAPMAREVAAA